MNKYDDLLKELLGSPGSEETNSLQFRCASAIRELTSERNAVPKALSRNFEDYATTLKALKQERDEALKALAECREDAERYRWMRSQPTADIYACWYPPVFPSCPDTPEQRDATIDAARGKK